MDKYPVIIIGAGLAGLSCAKTLAEQAIPFYLLEASDDVGGRVRTDHVDGCLLDRGFQVFQTAYPEAQRLLDYERLELVELEPGALIRYRGRWHRMSDPWRKPRYLFHTLFNPIGGFRDRLKLLRLRADIGRRKIDECLTRGADCSTLSLLRDQYGFSDSFIEGFVRPWLSGIFLESELATSANYFTFVFKMLSSGPIAYPRRGIQAIPRQLAEAVPEERLRLNCRVTRIELSNGAGPMVQLDSGEPLRASAIVIATDMSAAARLAEASQFDLGPLTNRRLNSTTCIYYLADQAPVREPVLMLNGDTSGPVNHCFVMTNAIPSLAPAGRALISVSLVGQSDSSCDTSAVKRNLQDWFGSDVENWQELRVTTVEAALPAQLPGFYTQRNIPKLPPGIVLCGDYLETTSVNGALKSGREAAFRAIDLEPT